MSLVAHEYVYSRFIYVRYVYSLTRYSNEASIENVQSDSKCFPDEGAVSGSLG